MTDNYAEKAKLYSLIPLKMPRRTENKLQHNTFKWYFKWISRKLSYRYLKWSMDILEISFWKQIKQIFNQKASN